MQTFVVGLHNIIRWVVVALAVVTLVRTFSGWFGKRAWTASDRKVGIFFTSAIDMQLLLGVLLYFVYSNWGLKAILEQGMSAVMKQDTYRFFTIEHAFYMLLGMVFAHLGSALPKRAKDDLTKHKRAAIFFSLAVLVILLGMPWFRPLLPNF